MAVSTQNTTAPARQDAWHGLGTALPGALSAEEALNQGGLSGWNIRKVPLVAQVTPGVSVEVPDKFAVVRDMPGGSDVLGTVGNFYHCIQNEELVGLLSALVDESGAEFDTAGTIDGGRRVFVTMKLPGTAKVGGVDRVDNYLAAVACHDGTIPNTMMVTPVRVACRSSLHLAYQNLDPRLKVRHRVGAGSSMAQQAHEALEFTFDYIDAFQEQAERLVNTPMSQVQFEKIIHKEFGTAPGAPLNTATRSQNKIEHMAELFAQSSVQPVLRNTAWAGLTALTEWHDHHSPLRTNGVGSELAARSRKALFDLTFKNRALTLMTPKN